MLTYLKVLIVEDSPDDADLLVRELRRAGFEPDWRRVETEAHFLGLLKSGPDLVLSAYAMPQFNGLRAIDLLRASGLDIPFILISGSAGEDIVVEAVKRGATDHLQKESIGRLGTVVRRAMHEVQERAQRRTLEAQLIEAQKMEVVGQLASGIAHDFNNILMTIMGYNDLISMAVDPASPLQHYISEVRDAAGRAAGLTRQLLVFSRREKVLAAVIDLNSVVQDLEKMLRRVIGEDIEMTVTPAEEAVHIKADPGYIGQILMNLAINARDAMPGGGKLHIEIGETSAGEAGHNGDAGGGVSPRWVMLSVTDSGTGIAPEAKPRLFEAFFTTKPRGKGTGLGLATCQTIVQQSGGRIEVESEPGKGTTFRVCFPRIEEPPVIAAQSGQNGRLPGGTGTLQVVEDEPSARNPVRGALASGGLEVLSASSSQETLSKAS